MIDVALKLRVAINRLCEDDVKLVEYQIIPTEWTILEELLELLDVGIF